MEEKIKLQIRNMKKHYKNGDGVENINMDVKEGEFLTMLGPSGCGKSTLLKSLNRMDEATSPEKQQRIAEMRFLRGHGHFLLKQLFKKIEKHGKCMLGYCFGGISGNIAPGNAAGSQIVFIQIIGSGSSNTDKLQMRCGMDCLFVNRNFIDNQNVCVLDPFRCFFRCGKVVSGDLPKCVESGKVNIITDCFCV